MKKRAFMKSLALLGTNTGSVFSSKAKVTQSINEIDFSSDDH